MSDKRDLHFTVPVLARVEGEASLELRLRDGEVEILEFSIFESPRLFEKFLEGRSYRDVPDMVARVCGICPVAYQMSAVQALEQCFGVTVPPWVTAMRRVMYCGEWIESHCLHIQLLAAPDFLGFDNVVAMAEVYPDEVRRGLSLQGLGNDLISLFGGRSVHPVGVCTGGFHKAPTVAAVAALRTRLQAGLEHAAALVCWTATLPMPDSAQTFTSVALRHAGEYPMVADRLVSDAGLDIDVSAFEQHIEEHQVRHSTALHAELHGEPYLVGPLARMNLNHDRLPSAVHDVLADTGICFPSRNMFHSIVARAAEVYLALLEAERLLADYAVPTTSKVAVTPRAGTGFGCTEAPRGALWHRYEFDATGRVLNARLVPPTSQNQARIEADLRTALAALAPDSNDDELRSRGEQIIRNYDPCISCATHFLRLRTRRE